VFSGTCAQCRIIFVGGEGLGVRKLLIAFFACSIYPLNSDQVRHEGGSQIPQSVLRKR
jgi:hypothetical protein